MKRDIDIKSISTIVVTCLVGLIIIVLIFSMIKFSDNTNAKQTESIEDILLKAAVQCYALEGEYPPNVQYIADHYGVMLNHDKYYYYYEPLGSNYIPTIIVVAKK